ncbi:MAG: hypothetical protein ACXV9T_13280 [Methylobacter sp.]
MSKIIDQKTISENCNPVWQDMFSKREYQYLTNVINGLIKFGELDEISIQFGEQNNRHALHIFEPFVTLNCLGFMSPSVVSIAFSNNNEIEYLTGNDNGLEIFSSKLTLESTRKFPRNSTLEIDFWHFVDTIGDFQEY